MRKEKICSTECRGPEEARRVKKTFLNKQLKETEEHNENRNRMRIE